MEGRIQRITWFASSGTQVHVPMGTDAAESMCAGLVMRQEKLERNISPHLVIVPLEPGKMISIPSTTKHPEFYGGVEWSTEDFFNST